MTKIYSLNSDVKFPDMEHYDMGKASDMALYLAIAISIPLGV